jgi:peptidoglycan/xylan/chitin deacetylase (PgdA/CDA1 family)
MSTWQKLNIAFISALMVIFVVDVVGSGISFVYYSSLVLIYVGVCTYGSFVLSAEFFLPVLWRGETSSRKIAVTFDDGPIRGKTGQILDILAQHQVKAAFFCIGNRIRDNEDILSRIEQEGHMIGNHTFYHRRVFGFLSAAQITDELKATDREVERVIGRKPRFFRPPYGVSNPMVCRAVSLGSYRTIGWSIRSFDTIIKDPAKLLKRIVHLPVSGDIVLLHDYSESTIAMLPDLISYLKNHMFQIVRLDELLKEDAYR